MNVLTRILIFTWRVTSTSRTYLCRGVTWNLCQDARPGLRGPTGWCDDDWQCQSSQVRLVPQFTRKVPRCIKSDLCFFILFVLVDAILLNHDFKKRTSRKIFFSTLYSFTLHFCTIYRKSGDAFCVFGLFGFWLCVLYVRPQISTKSM